jgi:hypothetical protein
MRKAILAVITIFAGSLITSGWAQTDAIQIKDQTFLVKILTPLSASKNKKGDKFTLLVLEPEGFKDAMIEAEVTKAKAAGKVSGKSELLFTFDKLTLKDGKVVPIYADLKEVSNSKGVANVDEEGRVIGKSSVKKDIARTAVLGGIGAAIGGIVGGASGAAKGAVIGAAIGLTITFSTKGEDIQFAPGSQFTLVVNSTKEK